MNNKLELKSTKLKYIIWMFSVFVVLLLCLPSMYVIIWSIFGTSTVGILGDFTFRWFKVILTSYDWLKSFLYSIVLAISSSFIATITAVLYFYFSIWYRRIYQTVGYILFLGPLFFPTVVYALALKITFGLLITSEWIQLAIGHITLLLPILYFLIESSNELIKIEWIYGSAIMGSSHREILLHIVYPILKKPISITFGVGILFSFDEIVLASLIIDSANTTVPKRMWDTINRQMDPTPAVIATILLFLSGIIIIFKSLRKKSNKKLS